MKGTEHFKQTIKEYLDGRAQTDELFAVSYAQELGRLYHVYSQSSKGKWLLRND